MARLEPVVERHPRKKSQLATLAAPAESYDARFPSGTALR